MKKMAIEPVKGYKELKAEAVAAVNYNKELEERILRRIEQLMLDRPGLWADARMLHLGKTKIEEAFMWINRAIFQPERVKLPEDGQ
jgi:hypothetical protein